MAITAEDLLDRLASAWNAHDFEGLAALFAEDCAYVDMALGVTHHGREGVKEFARNVYATMPDFTLQFPVGFRADDQVASEWIITASWNGDFEGVDCTGKPIRFTGLSRYELQGDLIARNIDCWDLLALARQLGVKPRMDF